jgi:hypothetical protein
MTALLLDLANTNPAYDTFPATGLHPTGRGGQCPCAFVRDVELGVRFDFNRLRRAAGCRCGSRNYVVSDRAALKNRMVSVPDSERGAISTV